MTQGYVKIHRQLLESSFHNKPNYFCLWITLLLMANHAETKFLWNGKEQTLKPGQILTGRLALSEQTGIPETTIDRLIGVMVRVGQIGQQKTTKYRIITVLKWNDYQILDNKRTTNGQQTDTYKNDKNEKKDIYIADESAKDKKLEDKNPIGSLKDLYKGFGLPPKVRSVSRWQDEASNCVKYFPDSKGKESSIFKCFKDNEGKARIAFSDCKELSKNSVLYFFKVYNELSKK